MSSLRPPSCGGSPKAWEQGAATGFAGGPREQVPRSSAGPVADTGSKRARLAQRELGELSALTWPVRPAGHTVAMIVDVLVDHPPGGAEQAYELGREEVARTRCTGIRLHSLLSRRNPRRAMRGRAHKHARRPRGTPLLVTIPAGQA